MHLGRAAWLGLSVAATGTEPHVSGSPQLETTIKGTILDFLKLAAEKPELAKELIELAARHEFEFADDTELNDSELDGVAGGLAVPYQEGVANYREVDYQQLMYMAVKDTESALADMAARIDNTSQRESDSETAP